MKKYKYIKSDMSLMQKLIDAGYPKEDIDHYQSDLYVYVNDITKPIVEEFKKQYPNSVEIFKDQITGNPMYDIAFQYTPDITTASSCSKSKEYVKSDTDDDYRTIDWSVEWNIGINYKNATWDDLTEVEQNYILNQIKSGFYGGIF